MNVIEPKRNDGRERVSIATPKDFDVSYFCGSGKGGQAKNKVASGVLIIHRETGAMGRASDSRSQAENKTNAFKRLVKTPKMQFWITKKLFEIRQQETLEQAVEKDMRDENLKFQVMRQGKWIEVQPSELVT